MSSEDYLIRQFSLIGAFLARVAGLREKGQHKKALSEIDQQLSGWTGMTPDEVKQLNASALSNLIRRDSKNDDYLKGLSELVFQKVILLLESGEHNEAKDLAHLSFLIYQRIEQHSENFSFETQDRISQLKTLISGA